MSDCQNNFLRKKSILISFSAIVLFTFLMIFGLRTNANFNPSTLVGKQAPFFESNLFPVGYFRFEDYVAKNNWKIVNFWSSSCYVCRDEASELENFYRDTLNQSFKNFEFFSVNIQNTPQEIADWQKNYNQTFPVIMDSKGFVSLNFGVTGTPETFFIDKSGVVRYRLAGQVNSKLIYSFVDWLAKNPQASEKESSKALSSLLKII